MFKLLIHTQKLIIKAKTSCVCFDIHVSKLTIVERHSFNFVKKYSCFVFSTKSGNTSCENHFLERNTTLGHKCIIMCIAKCCNHVFTTNWICRWFLTSKRPRSYINYFCSTTSFLKGTFAPKNSNNSKLNTLSFFLPSCFSNTIVNGLSTSSNFLQAKHDLHPHVFSMLLFHFFNNGI